MVQRAVLCDGATVEFGGSRHAESLDQPELSKWQWFVAGDAWNKSLVVICHVELYVYMVTCNLAAQPWPSWSQNEFGSDCSAFQYDFYLCIMKHRVA